MLPWWRDLVGKTVLIVLGVALYLVMIVGSFVWQSEDNICANNPASCHDVEIYE